MTRLRLLLPVVALSACEPLEPDGEEECYGHWDGPVQAEVAAGRSEPGGAALSFAPVAELAGTTAVTGATIELWVANVDPRGDCGVAVYVGAAPPDPSALPEIADGTSPPDEIDGLGVQVGSARLARFAADAPDQEAFSVAVSVDEGAYVTVAACPGAQLDVWADATVDVCTTDWEAIPDPVGALSVHW